MGTPISQMNNHDLKQLNNLPEVWKRLEVLGLPCPEFNHFMDDFAFLVLKVSLLRMHFVISVHFCLTLLLLYFHISFNYFILL